MKRFTDLVAECLPHIKELFPWDLDQLRRERPDVLLLDTREPYEFEAARIDVRDQTHAAVQRDGQGLRAAHAAAAGGHHQLAAQIAAEMPARAGRKEREVREVRSRRGQECLEPRGGPRQHRQPARARQSVPTYTEYSNPSDTCSVVDTKPCRPDCTRST